MSVRLSVASCGEIQTTGLAGWQQSPLFILHIETYRQSKRTLLRAFADVVPEVLGAFEHDLLVIVELVAAATRPGLQDRAGIMVPLKTCIRVIPVDSPAKITRIDVAGEALLVPVELVTNKVHLTSQGSVVALAAQVMSVGGNLGADLRGVVEGANLHWQQTGDHAHTRGRAEWRRAVGGVELNGGRGQTIQVRRLDLRVLVVHLELGSSELISHNVENVGLAAVDAGAGLRPRGLGERVEIRSHCEGEVCTVFCVREKTG